MAFLQGVLPWLQIGISVLLIASILLQQSSAGVGGAFGGGDNGGAYHSRRGMEKTLFNASIVFGILLALTSFAQLII